MNEILGYLDNIRDGIVNGWVMKKGFSEPIEVKIFINEKFRKVLANGKRLDLKRKGLHKTGYCGFNLDLRDILPFEEEFVEIRVTVDDKELRGSPLIYKLRNIIPKKKLALIHIPKTAGTSINTLFAQKLKKNIVVSHLESKKELHKKHVIKHFNFVSGHLIYGEFIKLLNEEFKIAVVLRDPMKQLISHLNWVRYISNDKESDFFKNHTTEIKELSLQLRKLEFDNLTTLQNFVNNLSEIGISLFDNSQTRYLNNQNKRGQYLSNENLQIAINNLRKIDFVGKTENLHSFIDQVKNYFEIDMVDTIQVLNERKEASIITQNNEIIEILYPLVALDYQLIAEANKLQNKINYKSLK